MSELTFIEANEADQIFHAGIVELVDAARDHAGMTPGPIIAALANVIGRIIGAMETSDPREISKVINNNVMIGLREAQDAQHPLHHVDCEGRA